MYDVVLEQLLKTAQDELFFVPAQGSPSIFVLGQHTLLHNSSRDEHKLPVQN